MFLDGTDAYENSIKNATGMRGGKGGNSSRSLRNCTDRGIPSGKYSLQHHEIVSNQ